jgi:hypothetical protein
MNTQASLSNAIDLRQSIAAAMRCPADTLQELCPGPEAGEDAGRIFYARTLGETTLAVRDDAARAYITQFGAGLSTPHTEKTLSECGLIDAQLPHLREVQSKMTTAQQWIKVADSSSANLECLAPTADGKDPSAHVLSALDQPLNALWSLSEPDATAAALSAQSGSTRYLWTPSQHDHSAAKPVCTMAGWSLSHHTLRLRLYPRWSDRGNPPHLDGPVPPARLFRRPRRPCCGATGPDA